MAFFISKQEILCNMQRDCCTPLSACGKSEGIYIFTGRAKGVTPLTPVRVTTGVAPITGGHSNQDPWWTPKPIYSSIFTKDTINRF